MERRFDVRVEELLDDAVLDGRIPNAMLERLQEFVTPFAVCLTGSEQQRHVWEYVSGLFSDTKRKNAETIAYFHDQDRQIMQKFVGQSPWDDRPMIKELARQIGEEIGEPDGVLVFDPSAFKKQGKQSVGVARQWCGRLGKIDNCQVGVYLGYVSRKEHALADVRLYLPEEWAKDRKRRKKCGVPREIRFRTRHALALEMLAEHGDALPHGWIAGDDEMGRSSAFRRDLRVLKERYLLDVPSNTLLRDLQAEPPRYGGRGRRPRVPFVRADRWREALPEDAWTTVEVRDGSRGPLLVQAAKTVAKAEHRIEECLERAKSEAGLAQYQVRNWIGWRHHQTLSFLATWFLTQENRRGKKIHAGVDGADSADDPRSAIVREPRLRLAVLHSPQQYSPPAAKRACLCVPLEVT